MTTKNVLGVSTKNGESEKQFWLDFQSKNPDYIPGWIELGNLGKVKEIDPNYIY